MNIEKDLKKDGITVIKPVDTLSLTLIAKYVAEKLVVNFPFYGFTYDTLFKKISNVPMYIATIPSSVGEASYFYKNSSIYFRDGLSIEDMQKYAIHEFIHCYQEQKDSKNILYRLGLCDYTSLKVHGMALNEGAVQLMASKALKSEYETVKYYDIEFDTNSPLCYPLICNLVNQMKYITGEDVLFESALHSNNKFKKVFSSLCGEKTYKTVEENLDKILKLEEKIATLTLKLENEFLSDSQSAVYNEKITNYKHDVKVLFINTQNLMLTTYFVKTLNNVYSEQEADEYRKRLYNYKDLIGTIEDYSYFNTFYIEMMSKLDNRFEEANSTEVSVVPYKRSILEIIVQKIHSLFKQPVLTPVLDEDEYATEFDSNYSSYDSNIEAYDNSDEF